MSTRGREMTTKSTRGFALPVAILGLVIMGVLVTGGFYVARQESRIGQASEHGTQAFYVAEHGIADVIVNWDMEAYGSDTTWSSLTVADTTSVGLWNVEITKITDRLFFLDSEGSAPLGAALAGGSIEDERAARRRVGMIVRVVSAAIEPPAALTTRGDVNVWGTAEVHGEDTNPDGWDAMCIGDLTDKPGVMVDETGTVTLDGGVGNVTGDPAIVQDPDITDETFTQFGDLSWVDLIAMADLHLTSGNFNGMQPSFNADGTCNTSDPGNWGDPYDATSACANYFPMIYVDGLMRVQSGGYGQGILLVEGDVDLRGGFAWHGIVITQGNFETQGTGNHVLGGVLASNAELGDERLVGDAIVQTSTCAVSRSILLN